MNRRTLFTLLAAVMLGQSATSAQESPFVLDVFGRINVQRKQHRLSTLTYNRTLEKAAQAFSKGADGPKEWVCLGCTPADQAFLAKPCAACKMRTCAIAKGVQNCAACDEYESCQMIQTILEPWGLAQRMGWLRERFVAQHGSHC